MIKIDYIYKYENFYFKVFKIDKQLVWCRYLSSISEKLFAEVFIGSDFEFCDGEYELVGCDEIIIGLLYA